MAESEGAQGPASGDLAPDDGSTQLMAMGRGCVGTIVSGGCGCGAFLVGAVLAVALFAPQLMAGWGTRLLEREIGSRIQGEVSVGDMTLSWNDQQRADNITILDEAGQLVLTGGMRMPSLLELGEGNELDQEFVFYVQLLKSTIDVDGSSNLGRTFGVTPDAGGTVVHALTRWALESFTAARYDGASGSMTVRVELAEAEIDDTASGREIVRLRDLSFRVSRSASGMKVRLDRGTILAEDRSIPISFSASYGRSTPRGVDELLRVELDAEGLSESTLMSLGLLPRMAGDEPGRDPRLIRDVFDRTAPAIVAAAGSLVTGARSIQVRFGVPREGPPGADPLLRVGITGPRGELDLEATVLRGKAGGPPTLVPPANGGRARLVLEAPGALAPLVAAAVPSRAVVAALEFPGGVAPITARIRDYALPLDRDLLRLGGPTGGAQRSPADRVARSLRRGKGELSVAGGDVVRVQVGEDDDADGRLVVRHVLSTVSFESGAGSFRSRWRHLGPDLSTSAAPRFSTVEGALPSSGADADAEPGTLRIDVHGFPLSLLDGVFPIEERVTRLLGARMRRFELDGLDAGVLVGRAPRTESMELELMTEAGDRLAGTVSREGLFVRRALFELPMDQAAVDDVLLPLMPWVERIRPLVPETPGTVGVELEQFTFPSGPIGGGLEGRVVISPPPLEVRLPESLLRDLRIEHERRWVGWAPQLIDVVLDSAGATYQAAELPLGDGRAVELSGTSRLGRYNLGGAVPPSLLRNLGGQDADENARVRIEISNQSDLERPRVLVSPAEFVSAIEEIIDLLSPENRPELLNYLRGN